VLVDDGIATGSTIIAAAQWLKTKQCCKKLVIAVPVAPPKNNTIDELYRIADDVVILLALGFYPLGGYPQMVSMFLF
jgi:putative phosphoribosyl transferase